MAKNLLQFFFFSFSYVHYLSENSAEIDKSKLAIVHWTWPSSGEPGTTKEPPTLSKEDAVVHSIDLPQSGKLEPSLSITQLKNGKTVCIITCAHSKSKYTLLIYDLESRVVISTQEFEEKVCLDSVSNGRALLRRKDSVEFYCLESNRSLDTFLYVDLAANVGATLSSEVEHVDQVRAKFDCNPARKQFVIFSNNLSFYQLMEYSTEEGFDKPLIVNSGSTHIYDLSQPSALEKAVLMNGNLFAAPVSEVRVVYHQPVIHNSNPMTSTVLACDLKTSKTSGKVFTFSA
jgi:hypothetical protein